MITAMKGKIPLAEAAACAADFCSHLKYRNGRVARTIVAGSIRRKAAVVGDVDLLLVGKNWPEWPEDADFIGGGTKQVTLHWDGVQFNIWKCSPSEIGSMLIFATGAAQFGVRIRATAKGMGLKLNRYGLWDGNRRLAGRTEDEIFSVLGMAPVPPELRGKESRVPVAQAPSSKGTATYTVSRSMKGGSVAYHCECTGFKFRGKCWHVADTQAVLDGSITLPHRGLSLLEAA